MKFINLLLAFAFMSILSLCVASDGDLKQTDEVRQGVSTGGLKGSSPQDADDTFHRRDLTWSWWRPKNRRYRGYRFKKKNKNKKTTTTIGTAGSSCDCERRRNFGITGFFRNATVAADNVGVVGGKYVFNMPLARDAELTQEFTDGNAFFASGDCTRIQSLLVDGSSRLLGAGLCSFVLSVITPGRQGTFTIQGELFDVIPSTFAITAGTNDFEGARGEVTFTPFYDKNGGTDVFTEASYIETVIQARILDDIL